MISVSFAYEAGGLRGFRISGHSGYAEAGSDIVCAAVTSAVRYAECTMNDILQCGIPFQVNQAEAEIAMLLGRDLPEGKRSSCQALLEGLRAYLKQLADEYPDYIEVSEV